MPVVRAAFTDGVADHEPGDADEEELGERCHPAVRRQEDDRRRRQAEHDRASHHERDEEVGPDDRQQHEHGDGNRRGRVAWRPHQRVHAGFPNKPYGRTASTTASSANVKMIA
jgi:hypothetical protein